MDMRAPDTFRHPAANPEWALAISDLEWLEQISRGAKNAQKGLETRRPAPHFFGAGSHVPRRLA
jgi:hypothetical protein